MTVLIVLLFFTLHALHLPLIHDGLYASYTLNVSRIITIRKITVNKGKLPGVKSLLNILILYREKT